MHGGEWNCSVNLQIHAESTVALPVLADDRICLQGCFTGNPGTPQLLALCGVGAIVFVILSTFRCKTVSSAQVDEHELEAAQWVSRTELQAMMARSSEVTVEPHTPKKGSISHELCRAYADGLPITEFC